MPGEYDVFWSHNSRDKPEVEGIAARLREEGLRVGGLGAWQEPKMRAANARSRREKVPVIPVLLPGCPESPPLSLFLEALTWVGLRGRVTDDGISRLVAKVPAGGLITLWTMHEEREGNRKDLRLGGDPNLQVEIHLKESETCLRGQVVDESVRGLSDAVVPRQGGDSGEAITNGEGRFDLRLSGLAGAQVGLYAERKGSVPVDVFCYAGRNTCSMLLEER